MKAHIFYHHIIRPFWEAQLLPKKMDTLDAHRFCLAIMIHESNFEHRRQYPSGPARGYAQHESISIRQICTHPATAIDMRLTANYLGFPAYPDESSEEWANRLHRDFLADNDFLQVLCCRLNIWWWPHPLPKFRSAAYEQYDEIWKPGKKRPAAWPRAWNEAEDIVFGI